ncbi:MAG: ABC transporter permease [Gemmatimonadaceae bacterium]
MTAIGEGERQRRLGNLLIHLTAIGAVAVIALAFLLVSGYDVSQSVAALWRGAFGSVDALVSSTLVRAVPLILLGVGIALAFRVGVFNVGGDGQFLAGAALGAWAALHSAQLPGVGTIIIALIAGAIGGAFWALLPALLRRHWGVFEVLSTLMMNFVATYAVSYLVRGPLQEPTHIYPQSATIPSGAHLPIVIAGSRLHAGFFISIACAFVAWVWLSFREGGLRARLTGANPIAAASAGGIDTGVLTFRVFIVSAALCGMAGAVEVLGVTFALYENLSPGYGFTAIAVALLAGLHPLGVVASAVLLAALDAGAATMQREAGVPSVAAWVIQALLVLAVLTARALADRGAGALRFARS